MDWSSAGGGRRGLDLFLVKVISFPFGLGCSDIKLVPQQDEELLLFRLLGLGPGLGRSLFDLASRRLILD